MRGLCVLAVSGLVLAPCLLAAQDEDDDEQGFFGGGVNLEISTELKTHFRWSEKDRVPLWTPFPPEFVPAGQENVALATVAPGSSLEVSKATVYFDVELPRQISARVKIDFIDLYDRNPTSTDKKIDVDEAWIAFGERQESLQPIDGTSFYALIGKAPKFERQVNRRIETYGLVSTAFASPTSRSRWEALSAPTSISSARCRTGTRSSCATPMPWPETTGPRLRPTRCSSWARASRSSTTRRSRTCSSTTSSSTEGGSGFGG